jgi:hypothetical protein
MEDTCNWAKSTTQKKMHSNFFFSILSSPINDDLVIVACWEYLDPVLISDWIQTIRASLNSDFWKLNCFWITMTSQ